MPTRFVSAATGWASEFQCKKTAMIRFPNHPNFRRRERTRNVQGDAYELAMTVNSRKGDADVSHRFRLIMSSPSTIPTKVRHGPSDLVASNLLASAF